MFVTVDGTPQEIADLLFAVRNRQKEAKPKDWLVTDLDPDAREELNKNLAQLFAGKPMPNKGAKDGNI